MKFLILSTDQTILKWKSLPTKLAEIKEALEVFEIEVKNIDSKPLIIGSRVATAWLSGLIKPYFNQGYDVVALHMSNKQRQEWGIEPSLRGSNPRSGQEYGDFYFWSDENTKREGLSQFVQTCLHEFAHEYYQQTGLEDVTHWYHDHDPDITGLVKSFDWTLYQPKRMNLKQQVTLLERVKELLTKLVGMQPTYKKQIIMNPQTLQIFRPLLSKKISQPFGENLACISPQGKIFGVKHSCPANSQSFYKSVGLDGHSGVDIPAIIGENVYHAATYPGWIRTEIDNMGGIGVDVVSNEPLFFAMPIPTELINTAAPVEGGFTHYVKMRYHHLSKAIGHDKKQVTCGTIVGLAGNTGASSGAHLHFAPKWCLPDGRSVASNNGYYGAFDPTPYYNHEVLAADHAKYMDTPVVPLSTVEQKDVLAQLSVAKQMLLALQVLMHKI